MLEESLQLAERLFDRAARGNTRTIVPPSRRRGPAGNALKELSQTERAVAVVTAEELITGIAGQGDGDVAAGFTRDVPGR